MRGSLATSTLAFMTLAAAALAPSLASAHVSLASGPGYANTTQEVTFGVGHGCEGSDTFSIQIDIPEGVTSVRAVPTSFGAVSVQKNTAGVVTSVTFTKTEPVLATDDNYYKLSLRIKVPNAPFTTVYFPTHQTCKKPDGTVLPVVDWVGTSDNQGHASDAGAAPEPAPALVVLPARVPGWNKVSVPVAVSAEALAKLFADAQIVWKGSAAFSANPATLDQIKASSGVTVLAALAAGDEIWVKY
jgi:uncharacterized protein YcnI